MDRNDEIAKEIADKMREVFDPETESKNLGDAIERALIAVKAVQAIFNIDVMAGGRGEDFKRNSERLQAAVEKILDSPIYKIFEEVNGELGPYVEEELKKPQYEGLDINALFDKAAAGKGKENTPFSESLFMQAIEAARTAKKRAEAQTATIRRAESVDYPLDKPNSIIWHLLEKDTRGQISFDMSKYGSKEELPAYYAINFDALDDVRITKRLLPFDKRVYIAVSALFNAGNRVITLTQIYYAMGYTGRPGPRDLQKINDAVSKMTSAQIYFDNEQESTAYKYPRFKYEGSLMPVEKITAVVNGKLADAAIHIFREPPLITFARQRKQITTIDIKLLQSPLSKTDGNILLEDYILERICKEKNNKKKHSCRILYKTLYEHIGLAGNTSTERQQKKRAVDKVKKYLDFYVDSKFIKSFTADKDGVTVKW